MKIELTDVDEYEMIRFVEDIAGIDGLTDEVADGINEVLASHGQAGISISKAFEYGREVYRR